MIEETHKLYDNQTVIDHYNRGYEEKGSLCPPDPFAFVRTYLRGWSRRVELHSKYNRRTNFGEARSNSRKKIFTELVLIHYEKHTEVG